MGAIAIALGFVGAIGGDERLVVLGAVGLALLVVSLVDGRSRLAGVVAERRLPAELWAGDRARGRYVVRAKRALRVSVREWDGSGAAGGDVRGETQLPALWNAPDRGDHRLDGLYLTTASPFGLITHRRSVGLVDAVVVWATPGHGVAGGGPEPGTDDLVGLRLWRVGERVSRIAWRASLRRGKLIAADRVDEQGPVEVTVGALRGEALERAVSDATGAVIEAARSGRRVGLRLGGRRMPSRSGSAWQRNLLAALARWDGKP